jgi:hypothetical protein
MLKNILPLIFLILPFSNQLVVAQTFGFGCLGFVGGYGGFTYQQYNPAGLNEYIEYKNGLESTLKPVDKFSYAIGFRVGLNFFRATFENGIILTAKGFYQYTNKKNKGTVGIGQIDNNYSLDLDARNWSLGFDVGWELTKVINWKIIDGSLNFNNVTLTETTDLPGSPTYIKKYKSDAGVVGYSFGTGVILDIFEDYVSVEGLAAYTYLQIDNIHNNDESPASFSEKNNLKNKFIESGGFTAVIQLNVGFPIL